LSLFFDLFQDCLLNVHESLCKDQVITCLNFKQQANENGKQQPQNNKNILKLQQSTLDESTTNINKRPISIDVSKYLVRIIRYNFSIINQTIE